MNDHQTRAKSGKAMNLNFYNDSLQLPNADASGQTEAKDAFKYIIQQNSNLHDEILKLKTEEVAHANERKALKREKQETEEEVYSLERSRTIMKGYLKNEIDLCKDLGTLVNHYEDKIVTFQKEILTITKLFVFLLTMYLSYKMILLTLSTMFSKDTFVYIFFDLSLFAAWFCFLSYTIKNAFLSVSLFLVTLENDDIVTERKRKIEETKMANDYIGDLIDNL